MKIISHLMKKEPWNRKEPNETLCGRLIGSDVTGHHIRTNLASECDCERCEDIAFKLKLLFDFDGKVQPHNHMEGTEK